MDNLGWLTAAVRDWGLTHLQRAYEYYADRGDHAIAQVLYEEIQRRCDGEWQQRLPEEGQDVLG